MKSGSLSSVPLDQSDDSMPQEKKADGGYEKREMLIRLPKGCLKLEGSLDPLVQCWSLPHPLEASVLLLGSTLGRGTYFTLFGPSGILKGHWELGAKSEEAEGSDSPYSSGLTTCQSQRYVWPFQKLPLLAFPLSPK